MEDKKKDLGGFERFIPKPKEKPKPKKRGRQVGRRKAKILQLQKNDSDD